MARARLHLTVSDRLERMRRETLDALVEHLADEHVDTAEFERRVAIVKEGADRPSIRAALAGLPGTGSRTASGGDG